MADPAEARSGPSQARRFLTFRVAERLYALPAQDVVEVMRVPPMTRVPQSPQALLGIANLRGEVLPVASLRGLLGIEEQAIRPTSRAIVMDVGARVAVVVDAVDALMDVESGRIEVRHSALGAVDGERLTGSFQAGTDAGVAKVLDIRSLLDAAFAQRSRAGRHMRRSGGTEAQERQAAPQAARAQMLVTFDVAGQEFALALEAVQEVLPSPEVRAVVPKADAVVLGVTSLRGGLLPLLSLRALLGFPPAAAQGAREKVVVMKIGGAQVGLVADRARAIVAADPGLVEAVPKVLAARVGGESRLRAIYRGDAGRRLISILEPEHLFREDVMQRLNEGRGAEGPADAGAGRASRDELDFLVFRLGNDEFALPIEAVDEVARVPARITRVPKTPKFLEGVVNLRGAVLPVIDQRRRFDMPKSASPETRRLVVVRTEKQRAGLIVDSVSDVLRVPAGTVEPAPELTEDIARLVRGVINLESSGRMVLLLDPPELLTRAERGLLDAFQTETAQANA